MMCDNIYEVSNNIQSNHRIINEYQPRFSEIQHNNYIHRLDNKNNTHADYL